MKCKKNVLLIIHDVYQDDNEFPIGVGYLAAMLEKNDYTVETYCMDVFHYTNEQLAQKLSESEYDIIGVGFMAARFKETIIDLCKVVNKNKKDAWFVLGGHGPSPIPEYVLLKTKADIVAIGEAEETIVDILKCKLSKKKDLSKIKGIAYRTDDKVTINPRRMPIKNLDELPFPAWHFFPMDKYTANIQLKGMEKDEKLLSIITSRGCINRCSFCYRMEKGIRLRSTQNVIDEIKEIKKRFGVTVVKIADELSIVSKKRVLEFERSLKENNLKIKFTGNARVDIFDKEIAMSLKRSGCILLNVGFESSSQKVLEDMNKNTTVEQNIKTLKIANEVGLPIGLNFIWGYPHDTKETLMNNVEWIKKYNLFAQVRTIRPVTPYPGCDLYYEALDKGLTKNAEDFFKNFNNSDLITVNFTNFTDKTCYEWLYEANRELILDHFKKTNQDMKVAEDLISQFKDIYDGKTVNFRGARHYDKDEEDKNV